MTLPRDSIHVRALGGLGILLSGCFWLWLREDRGPLVWIAASAWLAGFSLSLARSHARQTVGRWILALLAVFGVATWYVGRGTFPLHFARLDGSPSRHGWLVASTLGALLYASVSILDSLERAVQRLAARARDVLYAVCLLLSVAVSADMFFVGRGVPYDYNVLRPSPIFAPGAGSFANRNVLERMVTDSDGNGFSQRKPDGTVRIVLDGASTMWGHGLAEPETPDAVLRTMLAERYPDRRFEVIQLAVPGKTQEDELIDTVLLASRWHPDLIISLNGFNDAGHHPSDQFESRPYWWGQVEKALGVRAMQRFFFETTQVGPVFWQKKLNGPEPPEQWLLEPDLHTPPRFFANLEATARNARDLGIRYAFSVTPNIYLLDKGSPREHREFSYRRRVAAEIVTAVGQASFDASELLYGRAANEVFFDNCHLTKLGVERVCAAIAARIPGWLATSAPVAAPTVSRALGVVEHLDAIPGAPFLKVTAGAVTSDRPVMIRDAGRVGLLVSGPAMTLEAGKFRIEWWGKVHAPGVIRVDLARRKGGASEEIFLSSRIELPVRGRRSDLDVGDVEGYGRVAAASFDIEEGGAIVEPRLHVESADLRLEIDRVLWLRLARLPTDEIPAEWDDSR